MIIRNIIVVGDIGTGSTTLAKSISQKIGWKYLSSGDFFRKWHQDHGVPLIDTLKIPPELDRQVDFGLQKKLQTESFLVVDSRLGGWLARDIKDSFKILCIADESERASRVARRESISEKDAYLSMKTRAENLALKFLNLYNVVDALDPKFFDLVVDTTHKSSAEVLNFCWEKIKLENTSK